MKSKKTFLASLALGLFLFALAAPVISADTIGQELGIDKRSIVLPSQRPK